MGRGGVRETPSRGQELTAAASFPTLLELFILLYVYECLPACVHVHLMCAVPAENREGIGASGTGAISGCELPCG